MVLNSLLEKHLLFILGLTRIGEAKIGRNLLLPKSFHQSDQQLMTEAPFFARQAYLNFPLPRFFAKWQFDTPQVLRIQLSRTVPGDYNDVNFRNSGWRNSWLTEPVWILRIS